MKHLIKSLFSLILLFTGINAYSQQTVSTPRFRREFLEYINHTRQIGCNCGITYIPPAPPLVWNSQLEIAAIGHAQDMANNNYFSHTSLDGRTMGDRIRATGFTFTGYRSFTIGENIAQGPQSIAEVMQGWFKSTGHCKNLMNPGFREVGVAQYNGYWVQDFGGREPFSAQEQKLIKSGKYRLIEN
ncbi:MAG TPA: CAP domain-containing protein [Mucilaginibacter sp.]|jgi:uncharacterized protein YkwD|nr:CAP domain-containing protein [Mucilaginibacter sp.]